MPENQKTSNSKWCWWACLVPLVGIAGFIAFMAISEFSSNKKAVATSPERVYQYHEVPSEVRNRNIDCTKVIEMPDVPKRGNVLCLNLYQTGPDEINQGLKNTAYQTVMLYGEKIFFEAERQSQMQLKNYGQSLYDTAKFTDQITVPQLMKLFGLEDLSYMNINPRKTALSPYDALYIRLAHGTDTPDFCDHVASGCASGWYGIVIPESSISEHSFNMTLTRENGDTETLKYNWPKNCYTDHTFLHEIAHTFTFAGRMYLHSITGAAIPYYMTEYVAGLIGREGPEFVCGKGTVTYESKIDIDDKGSANLVEFNSVFPPVALSHHHPEDDCNLAILALWNQYVAKDWPNNFAKFFSQNYADNLKGVDHGTENAWGQFVLDLNGTGKDYLNSHGCKY